MVMFTAVKRSSQCQFFLAAYQVNNDFSACDMLLPFLASQPWNQPASIFSASQNRNHTRLSRACHIPLLAQTCLWRSLQSSLLPMCMHACVWICMAEIMSLVTRGFWKIFLHRSTTAEIKRRSLKYLKTIPLFKAVLEIFFFLRTTWFLHCSFSFLSSFPTSRCFIFARQSMLSFISIVNRCSRRNIV